MKKPFSISVIFLTVLSAACNSSFFQTPAKKGHRGIACEENSKPKFEALEALMAPMQVVDEQTRLDGEWQRQQEKIRLAFPSGVMSNYFMLSQIEQNSYQVQLDIRAMYGLPSKNLFMPLPQPTISPFDMMAPMGYVQASSANSLFGNSIFKMPLPARTINPSPILQTGGAIGANDIGGTHPVLSKNDPVPNLISIPPAPMN